MWIGGFIFSGNISKFKGKGAAFTTNGVRSGDSGLDLIWIETKRN